MPVAVRSAAVLGTRQQDHDVGGEPPRFGLYLDILLRGRPARLPPETGRQLARRHSLPVDMLALPAMPSLPAMEGERGFADDPRA